MIILTSTDTVQVLLGDTATTQLQCYVAYRDTTTTSITPGRRVVSTNDTTAVSLVDSPAASTQRVVDYMSVHNTDSNTAEVTIRFNDGTNTYTFIKVMIASGEKLEYQDGEGFRIMSNASGIKSYSTEDGTPAPIGFNMLILKKDVSNTPTVANASIDVPNLTIGVRSGKRYWFRYVIFYNADQTTTGSRFNLYGVSTRTLYMSTRVTLTSTTETAYAIHSDYLQNTTSGATSANTTGNVALIEGFVTPDWDGVIVPNFATGAASGNITVKESSFVQYQEL